MYLGKYRKKALRKHKQTCAVAYMSQTDSLLLLLLKRKDQTRF